MANDLKRTEAVKLNLTERELLDASRLAALEDQSVGVYIRSLLRVSLYGHVARTNSVFQDSSQ